MPQLLLLLLLASFPPGSWLQWDHDGGAASFNVFIDDALVGSVIAPEQKYQLLLADGSYIVEVTAVGPTGEESARSLPLAFVMQQEVWDKMTSWDAEDMVSWGTRLVVDFGPKGLWVKGVDWTKITSWDPESILVHDGKLIADFGYKGLWKYE